MENWGLITYRERVLLDYPGETSQSTREYIALVVAHETSHQWFGNLVTMRWWDDLWLNESFANMMEYQAVDAMFPEWHVWNQFIASEGLAAFRRDATYGVQSVHVDVHHPDEISTLFDGSIVYAKGGRLLYMMKNYIGETAFRAGLSEYFKAHAYGNTTGNDLWAALSKATHDENCTSSSYAFSSRGTKRAVSEYGEVSTAAKKRAGTEEASRVGGSADKQAGRCSCRSGKDVGSFMTPWLSRSGFPVVHVAQEGKDVSLTQEHFLDDTAKADPTRFWPVPTFANATETPEVFESSQVKCTLQKDNPLVINTGTRGHYLVQYISAKTKSHLESLIAKQTIGEPDRLMLLNGSAMLARAGYQSYADTLALLEAYKEESSEPVWDIMGLVAAEVRRFIDADASLESAIKDMSRKLVAKQYARLGWEEAAGEPVADTKLRSLILGLGAYGENEDVLTKARSLFASYQKDASSVPAELRALVLSIPVKEGDEAAVEFLLTLHDETQNSELKGDACDALTATRDPKVAQKLLGRLKDGKLVKPQDVDRWLIYLLRNRYTRDIAWQWMVDEWAWLQKTFENDKSYDYLPRYAASVVNTRDYEQKYHDLFDGKLDQPMLKRNISVGFEEITARLAWLERDLAAIQTFFK
jgi:aminopeptidase N